MVLLEPGTFVPTPAVDTLIFQSVKLSSLGLS